MVQSDTMLARDGKAVPAKLDLLGVPKGRCRRSDGGGKLDLRETMGRRRP
jgi:hypothetical protein